MALQPQYALLGALLLTGLAWLIFRPGRGLWPRWRQARQRQSHVLREDALKCLYQSRQNGLALDAAALARRLELSPAAGAALAAELAEYGLAFSQDGKLALTAAGRSAALHLIRAHRLWEQYLAQSTGYAATEWHDQAEAREHQLSPIAVSALSAHLGHPTHDPHGDPIPTATGVTPPPAGIPLLDLPPDTPAVISHIEDEPPAVFAQLHALGLHPGQTIRLIAADAQQVRLWDGADEHVLAPLLAANVTVRPVKAREAAAVPAAGARLSQLRPGAAATITALSTACRGPQRRRFLDLGLLPGTTVRAELVSPSGDPTAYLVRDTLIALRREQADLIFVDAAQTPGI